MVLTSRSGIKTGYQARYVESWRERGVTVVIDNSNIASRDEANTLIDNCLNMGPIGWGLDPLQRGVFHLAMVLRDTLFETQTIQNFKDSAEMKYWGTKNLDSATREKCRDNLKWFVVFSSISSGRGNSGQTNYGWANSTMERMIEQRRHDGHPGIAIQWGAIGDVGVVIDTMQGDNSTVVGGTLPQRMSSCLATLDVFLSWDHPIVSSYVRADTTRNKGEVAGSLLEKIARIVGVADASHLDLKSNLSDLGIDSLMGVEIKSVLERDYAVVLSNKEIRTITIADLNSLASGDVTSRRENTAKEEDKMSLERQMNQLFKLRVDVNDLLSHEEIVPVNNMPTSDGVVFFVHSIEGIATPLKKLCSLLNKAAYCLQVTPQTPMDKLENTATHYINIMRKSQPQGPYQLVGYSYGAMIAFEMAVQLNQAGEKVQVILLDGSHAYMRTYREAYRMAYGVNDDQLVNNPFFETEILCGLGMRFVNFDYNEKRASMIKLSSWEERVMSITEDVMKTGLFDKEDTFVWFCNSLRQKFTAADRYDPQNKLNGDITLLRAKQAAIKIGDVGHDYGLNEIVTGQITVHVIEGDHDSIVQGANSDKTAELIMNTFNV